MKLILLLIVVLSLSSEGFSWYRLRGRKDHLLRSLDLPREEECCEDRWIDQFLDHFNSLNPRSWQQRYHVNDKFYKEGGPAFLMVNGEQSAYSGWLVEGASLEAYLAKKFGAKLYSLEHRYYGMSRPTSDLTLGNMAYLNADQALADTAHFIEQMYAINDVAPNTKWILFGGSYAGSLVAWMRLKYPHLVHGAVANSAPLLAQVDFEDFYLVVEAALKQHSAKCYETLKVAFNDVHAKLQNKTNYANLVNTFKVCENHFGEEAHPYDVVNFYEKIVDVATEVVFNNDSYNLTIEKTCDILEDESKGSPLQRLTVVSELLMNETYQQCLSLEKYQDILVSLKNTSWDQDIPWDRRWIYQTCTEFGWYQTTSGRPFDIPTDAIPVEMYKNLCIDVFGTRHERMLNVGVQRTNLIYGGLAIANGTNNVIFVHGSNDPWHAAGVIASSNKESPVLYVEGGGHCPVTYPPSETDSPQKLEAKLQVEKIVESWLQDIEPASQQIRRWPFAR